MWSLTFLPPLLQGILSDSIPWKTLQAQFFEDTTYEQEIKKLIVSPEKVG